MTRHSINTFSKYISSDYGHAGMYVGTYLRTYRRGVWRERIDQHTYAHLFSINLKTTDHKSGIRQIAIF